MTSAGEKRKAHGRLMPGRKKIHDFFESVYLIPLDIRTITAMDSQSQTAWVVTLEELMEEK
jgi:hypothetical protein